MCLILFSRGQFHQNLQIVVLVWVLGLWYVLIASYIEGYTAPVRWCDIQVAGDWWHVMTSVSVRD